MRYRRGSVIHDYTGHAIKNRKGEIVTKAIFGFEEGQIKVTALGRTKDRVRLTDVDTGEKHEISRYEYERLKEELRAGHFKNKEVFFKATYWYTQEGMNAKGELATDNFEKMLKERYGNEPDFDSKVPFIIELFRGLSHGDKADFFEKEDKLVRNLWVYDQKLPETEFPELKESNELDFITKKLKEYYSLNPNAVKVAYMRSLTQDNEIMRMIRNV